MIKSTYRIARLAVSLWIPHREDRQSGVRIHERLS